MQAQTVPVLRAVRSSKRSMHFLLYIPQLGSLHAWSWPGLHTIRTNIHLFSVLVLTENGEQDWEHCRRMEPEPVWPALPEV